MLDDRSRSGKWGVSEMHARLLPTAAAVMCLLCLLTQTVQGDVLIKGAIGTTTWTAAESPYRITWEARVNAGNTLTIEPGVIVLFDSTSAITISGTLNAQGTETDSILFMPGYAAEWRGLRFTGTETCTLSYARLSGSRAQDTTPDGGAMSVENTDADVVVTHSVLFGNSSEGRGGAVAVISGSLEMRNCLIRNNTSTDRGGGLFTDVTGPVLLDYCTIADNTVTNYGGWAISTAYQSILRLNNCILWGNSGGGAGEFNVAVGSSVNVKYTSTAEPIGVASDSNITGDPLFVDAASGDYSLQAGSPCVDAGFPYEADVDMSRSDMGYTGGGGGLAPVPRIEVNVTDVFTGTKASGGFYVKNTGGDALTVTGFSSPTDLSLSPPQPVSILPGDSLFMTVPYTGTTIQPSLPCTLLHDDAYQSNIALSVDAYVGTPIYTDTVSGTWTAAGSPYYPLGSGESGVPIVFVAAGTSLIIEAGVEVIFSFDGGLFVEGSVHGQGTEQDSIYLHSDFDNDGPWLGVVLGSGDSSSFAYTHFQYGFGGYLMPENPFGGVISAIGSNTRISLTHCLLDTNAAVVGGAILAYEGADVTLDNCILRDNVSLMGGGAFCVVDTGYVYARRTLMYRNEAMGEGGLIGGDQARTARGTNQILARGMSRISAHGMSQSLANGTNLSAYLDGISAPISIPGFGPARAARPAEGEAYSMGGAGIAMGYGGIIMENCTVDANYAAYGGDAIAVGEYGVFAARNCILGAMENAPMYDSQYDTYVDIIYSDVYGGWPGEGNIDAWPEYADTETFDLHLTSISPCVSAGDPTSPRDPDESLPEMGAYTYEGEQLILPGTESKSGNLLIVPVTGTVENAYSIDMVFTIDTTIFKPDAQFIRTNAFTDQVGGETLVNVHKDTIEISLASSSPATLTNTTILELAFRFEKNAAYDVTTVMEWLLPPESQVDEVAVPLSNGYIDLPIVYGDVSGNRAVSAWDAAMVLQHVVGSYTITDTQIADVSTVDGITAYDASLVLTKVVDSSYLFPAEEGGGSGPTRPASTTPRVLSWVAEPDGWALIVDDPNGIQSCQLTMTLPENPDITVAGPEMHALNQEDGTIRLALVRGSGAGDVLFHLQSEQNLAAAPEIIDIQFNEGAIPVSGINRPLSFILSGNVPNPFNPTTAISYGVTQAGQVSLVIHNVLGQRVATLVNDVRDPGIYTISWNGRDDLGRPAASGVYVYRLTAAEGVLVRRMLLVR